MRFSISPAYSDNEIILILQKGDVKTTNKVVEYLYSKNWKKVLSYIKKNSGSEDDASDIFQEALVVFYNQVEKNKFEGKSSISTYLFGIAKNLWFSNLKKRRGSEQPLTIAEEDSVPEIPSEQEINNMGLFYKLFDRLSEECQKILKLAYFESLSMQEIQMQFEGLNNVQSAKTKKYRCLKNLMGIYKDNCVSIENFYI